jgi:fatty acyl-CoA reductase
LMRPKRGVATKERLEKITDAVVRRKIRFRNFILMSLMNLQIFDEIKFKDPNLLKKLKIIDGDCMKKNLGISEEDEEKLQSVSVIFHVAASTRFDDPLKKAILLNTRGALETCKLAEKLKKLDCLCHVSTAYFDPKMKIVEEKFYASDCDWKRYIAYAENLDENVLQTLSQKYDLISQ